MSEIAIHVQGLGKQYHIGRLRRSYRTFGDALVGAFGAPVRALRRLARRDPARDDATIWALRNVTFDLRNGEVLGVIGRNGAGKSTLLKLLSRITEPTEGFAEIRGRVGSLLEVGTGFHPQLTGRENIFLNGAILGMRRREIARKFDEIVAFAGVATFIDTPVKHYSSGMYLRLAFAVAAHLEPEILLVDEVLAVGDADFQKKCLGKMGDVAREGRTILFVSHNMAAIRQLCPLSLLFEEGRVLEIGPTESVIATYLNVRRDTTLAVTDTQDVANRSGTGKGKIVRVGFTDALGRESTVFGIGQPFRVWFDVELPEGSAGIVAGMHVMSANGLALVNLRSDSQGTTFPAPPGGGAFTIEVEVPGLPLYPGDYLLEPWIGDRLGKRLDHLHSLLWISLESRGEFRSELVLQPGRGIFFVDSRWKKREVAYAVSEGAS